jgi:hypothetical protein
METKVDQTISYGQTVKRDSEYKFTRIVQNTGGESVSIVSSEQSSTFELPSVAFNFAKSVIRFQQVVPENTTATRFAHAFRDTPPWARVELYTRGGTYLMDITNFSNIYQALGQRTKTVEDFHCSDNDVLIKTALNDLETKKLESGTATVAATPGSGNVTIEWRIRGEELYNTILSLDKTILLGEVLNLRITWNSAQKHGYWSQAALATPVDIPAASAVEINNLVLYLAQENNATITNELNNVISSSGMSILIPYVHSYKTNLGGSSNAVSLRFSRGHGISLERVYTLFTTGAEEKDTRFVSDVAQFTSFYSLLDSKRLQEFDINVPAGDYKWMKRVEKNGRVVGLTVTNDSLNFAHSDSWCGDELQCAVHQHIGGLDLSTERKYDLYVTRTGAVGTVNYYSAAVCQKQMMIGPGGVSLM